jgi:hypothetical protein
LYGKNSINKFIKIWETKAEQEGQRGKWLLVNGDTPYNEDLIKELDNLKNLLEEVKWVRFLV